MLGFAFLSEASSSENDGRKDGLTCFVRSRLRFVGTGVVKDSSFFYFIEYKQASSFPCYQRRPSLLVLSAFNIFQKRKNHEVG